MSLKKLRMLNFRNHRDFKGDFFETNIILGPNGSGKTNIVEAIYLLSTTRSFRTSLNQNLISFGSSFCKVGAEVENDGRNTNLEMLLTLGEEGDEERKIKKEAKIDGKPRRLISLLGAFFVVLFTPESLNLVLGPPSLRRRFMDLTLSSLSKQYARTLYEFLKILRQRNKLLFLINQGRAKDSQLDFWNQGFLKTSSILRTQRKELLDDLNSFLPSNFRLSYLPSPLENLEGIMESNRSKEINAGFTLFGPQKDDFIFLWNKKFLSWYGSRGEIREFVIHFKLAELLFFKQKTGFYPVLILDDVFSELDKNKRSQLKKFIFKGQIIFTATSLSLLDSEIIKKAKILELK